MLPADFLAAAARWQGKGSSKESANSRPGSLTGAASARSRSRSRPSPDPHGTGVRCVQPGHNRSSHAPGHVLKHGSHPGLQHDGLAACAATHSQASVHALASPGNCSGRLDELGLLGDEINFSRDRRRLPPPPLPPPPAPPPLCPPCLFCFSLQWSLRHIPTLLFAPHPCASAARRGGAPSPRSVACRASSRAGQTRRARPPWRWRRCCRASTPPQTATGRRSCALVSPRAACKRRQRSSSSGRATRCAATLVFAIYHNPGAEGFNGNKKRSSGRIARFSF